MSLTIPNSLNVKQGEIIAIKADDWNQVNKVLDELNEWRQTQIAVPVPEGWDKAEPAYVMAMKPPEEGNSHPIFSNITTTTVSKDQLITATVYNEINDKINHLMKPKGSLPMAIKDQTIITAELFINLMKEFQNLLTDFTVNITYIKVTEMGVISETIPVTFYFDDRIKNS